MDNVLKVKNSEGLAEPFSKQKVYRSARNAGANKRLAEEVAEKIEKMVYPNIKTSKIFKEIKNLLRKENFKASLRFELKAAMRKLGPTGFPFEKYIKAIFESKGFKTKINVYIKGKCGVEYEIDILAEGEKVLYVGECKYRNFLDKPVGISVALGNYARFLDLKSGSFFRDFPGLKAESMLISNAKFTGQAVRYSNCVGVKLLGWKHSKAGGFERIIEENNLYPVTILPALSTKMANIFIAEEKMLASDVLKININEFSKRTRISVSQLERLQEEAKILLADDSSRTGKNASFLL